MINNTPNSITISLPEINKLFQLDSVVNTKTNHIFWKDEKSIYQAASKNLITTFGFKHLDELHGKNDSQVRCKANEHYQTILKQDKKVLTGQPQTTIDVYLYANEQPIAFYTKKTMLVDKKQNTLGLLGNARIIRNKQLIHTAMMTTTPGRTLGYSVDLPCSSLTINDHYENFNLSKRESDCLFYLLRGYTAKETAKILNLSYRTVETYLIKIKDKLHCTKKSEIVEKAISKGYMNILPPSLFNNQTGDILSIN